MAGRIAQIIDQWRLRKVQQRWSKAAEDALEMEPFALRALRAEARAMRREIDRVVHVADNRLSLPLLAASLPRAPLGTDWAWRADPWRAPLAVPGAVADGDRTEVCDGVTLYHDCPLGEVSIRQIRNGTESDRAPYGLAVETFGFQGSFLSLSLRLPDQAAENLKLRHLLRLDAVIDAERPLRGYARLNIKHGPNVAQLVSDLPTGGREILAEFDLAYAKIDETRVERMWLDLIFNEAAMTRITLRDVVVSRRPRAEL
jgi:hypothetical protein